jgi:outer membrane murein-binding lipoprotein Lpp
MADSEDRSRLLPKDIRRLNDQVTALEKQNTRLQAKSEAAALELARTKSTLEMRDKDLALMRKNFAK